MKPIRILVIDDESIICDACELVLSEKAIALSAASLVRPD